jgi:uncharacterized membrane protein YeaQ/YmgE (transglycosylase-associated protein family)
MGKAGVVAWILFVIVLVAEGFFVGALGRLVVPGPDPMSAGKTVAVGIAGSLLAGVVTRVLFGSYAGVFLSVAGAAFIVWLLRRWDERHGRRPAAAARGRQGRWFVGPGIAGGVWTNARGTRRDPGAPDRRSRPSARRHDPDEIVDAEVVDEVPPGAQVVESEIVGDDEHAAGSARRSPRR